MAGAQLPLTFRIFKGDTFLREQVLSQAVIKIGKLSSSHLRLDDESVSRMHAVIEVSGPDDISIIDLGSTKGTVVNGQKVNKAKLQNGDLIGLGDIRIEFEVGEDSEDQPTRVNVGSSPSSSPPPAPTGARPAAAPPPAPTGAAAPASVSSGGVAVAPPSPPAAAPPSGEAPAAPPPGVSPPPGAAPSGANTPAPPPGIAPPPGFGGAPPQRSMGGDSIDELGGARAVEVAAMLGGSVVGVKHVANPRGGKVTTTTYGFLAVGCLLLLTALISFYLAIANTATNDALLEAWLAEGRAYHEFRPQRLSLIFDWLAFVGVVAGVSLVVAAIVRWREERVQPYCKIGRANDVDFALDSAPAESFPLVAPSGDDFVFNFGPGMDGEMTVDGQAIKLSELQAQGRARPSQSAPGGTEVSIPDGARFHVTAGQTTFLVTSVAKPKRHPVPLFASLERSVVAFVGGTAVVVGVILLLINSIPPDPRSLALGADAERDRLSSVQTSALEDPLQEQEKGEDEAAGGTGTAMALDEGKMGDEESKRATGQYAMEDRGADEPQLAKKEAVEQARDSGVAGILRAQEGDMFASLTGTGDFSSGLDDRDVGGGLLGDEVGTMQGGFGFGVSGTGPGGGGTGWGTIGKGRYGTIGHGSGTGSGYGAGSGAGGMRSRESRPPQVRIGNATSTGELDKNIIRRYIRQRLPRIRHCYEKELLVKQGLRGTVVTQFQISPNGSVLGVSASGMGDKNVESCVGAAIQSIQFPAPKGGGLVNVRYPFTFQPPG